MPTSDQLWNSSSTTVVRTSDNAYIGSGVTTRPTSHFSGLAGVKQEVFSESKLGRSRKTMAMASTTVKIEKVVDKAYQNEFMKGLHQMRQNEQYTDLTLQSGDVHIRCHRIVLEAASDYFKAMFRCGLEESMSATVPLTMEPEILTSIVDYMYTGEIELTVDNVESLVKAGDLLQLGCLKARCADFMASQVELHNCIEFYRFALLYRLDQLQKVTKQFVYAEFKTVALIAEFKELSCGELIEFIKDDDVNVEDEDIVFDGVIDWVRYDLDNRKSSLQTILEHVRMPYCTRNYMLHMKNTYDLLTPKCFEYLHEATLFQLDTVHQHAFSSCRTVPRTNFRMKSCLLLVGLYDVCRVDKGLLVTGGSTSRAVNQCWLYDFATKKWEEMPRLITARWYHRSVSLDDCVYVVGGKDVNNTVLASVECLNAKRKQWMSLPEMPQAVFAPAVVTYNNKIFVFGGRDSQDEDLCCTQVFDTTQGQWSTLSDMPEVCSIGCCCHTERLYLCGGRLPTHMFEI
ncbi:Kelch-like protein 21 [Lamellibrachia satsuma]|nr:Kelch-like protein 21 [Lamellibrachia satsuma]